MFHASWSLNTARCRWGSVLLYNDRATSLYERAFSDENLLLLTSRNALSWDRTC
jgi:hypothetical protein